MSDVNRDTGIPEDTERLRPQSTAVTSHLANKLIFELRPELENQVSSAQTVELVLENEGLKLADIDPELLTDMVYVEWMVRVERGELPSRSDFRDRFPMISVRLQKQWSLDDSLNELSAEPSLLVSLPPTALHQPADLDRPMVTVPRPSDQFDWIGKYRIISRLGAGGQAEVFRAIHPDLKRDVVIKLLRPALIGLTGPSDRVAQRVRVERMVAEGMLLARLSHPNIAHVYDIDRHLDRPFLVMEYLQGLSLDQFLRTHPLKTHAVARLLASVARAVAAAHELGIQHRDIKPQNIVVLNDGTPKLIDFGLAEVTDAWNAERPLSQISGTISFMAPEQAIEGGARIGPASDVFALGAVLYFVLTGRPPFHGTSFQEVCGRVQRCEWDRKLLDPPQIPTRLAAICSRAMQLQPADRFATATEMAQSLEAFATWPRRRRRLAAALVMSLTISVTAWLAWTISFSFRDAKQASTTASLPNGPPKSSSPAVMADLRITVHRGTSTIELNDAVPLKAGDELSVEANVPAGLSVVLLSVNGAGQLQHVTSVPKRTSTRRWRYPEESDATVPLTGSAGTECLVLIGQSAVVPMMEPIKEAWISNSEWPSLPPPTVLHFVGTDAIREQVGRDLGLPRSKGGSPTDQVIRTFQRFARQLESRYQLLEGLAFRHIESND